MGIPTYFKYITTQYDNLIINKLKNPINRLFLDLNCAIHPKAQKVLSEYPNLKKKLDLERKIYYEVLDYIKYLLEFTQPQDLLFIAIDGVAPRAKMQQQRYRRFKASKDLREKKMIYTKHSESFVKNDWDTNAITPGTSFMSGLSKYLGQELKKVSSNIKIILSDANDPNEGEHKIFNYIKKNYNKNNGEIDVIYGLDADLIMLSLTTFNSNIYLLREYVEFGNIVTKVEHSPFLYLDINTFKDCIIGELRENGLKLINNNNIITDYVFLCFLMGNDFLPHTLSLAIKNGGINILLEYYLDIVDKENKNYYLININKNKYSINVPFFKKLIKKIAESESDLLTIKTKDVLRSRIHHKDYKTSLEKELHLYEYLPVFNRQDDKYINMGSFNWRQRYYEICFKTEFKYDIDQICLNYLEGLHWTLNYYFDTCISYSWFYRYIHPPAMEDVKNFLEENNNFNLNNCLEFNKVAYKPFVQLLIVLPSSSYKLLAESYQFLTTKDDSDIIDLYPQDFKLDTIGKYQTWQCLPIIPLADDQRIMEEIDGLELTKTEQLRNNLRKRKIVKDKFLDE